MSAATPTDPVVEMADVAAGTMRNPEAALVAAVNWTVAAGEFWVIAGLSGAGKSDFLMLTAGLLPPRCGSCRWFGEPPPVAEEAQLEFRLRVGLGFDGGHLFNELTLAENVALPLQYHERGSAAEIAERVERLLELTELTPWAERSPGMLSRNWQKRVGLARALALAPELLLLDMPLNGADGRHAAWWLDFLTQLAAGHEVMPDRRPVTLVVTTNDLRPWEGGPRRYAVLGNQRLTPFANWAGVAAGGELVKELLARNAPHE